MRQILREVVFVVLLLLAIQGTVSRSSNQRKHKTHYKKLFKKQHIPHINVEGAVQNSNSSSVLTPSNMKTKWITQKLDNFDKNNNETWKMRYLVDDTVYKPGSPLFIYVGAEWTIEAEDPYYYQIVDFVQEYNGLLLYTEHRFFGESRPKPDLRTEYLDKYFSIDQPLADLAHFIRTMKQTVPGANKSKVILVGASYAGSLVTWFTERYPELTDGTWASSALLNMTTDYFNYKVIMGKAILAKSGQECYNRIQSAIEQAQNMFKDGRGEELKAKLNLCDNFNVTYDMDRWNLFDSYSAVFAGLIQYAKNNTIQEMCTNFTNNNTDLDNFVNYFLYNFQDDDGECSDFSYQENLEYRSNITDFDGYRQWFYLNCNEIGYFQTSTSTDQPFGSQFPLTYDLNFCHDTFGKNYTAANSIQMNKRQNKKYGGLTPNVTNTFFSQGSLDPWRGVGNNSYVIDGASHCRDLFKPTANDSIAIAAVHKKVAGLVAGWVKGE